MAKKEFNQLCVLEGTVVGNSKKVQEDFIKFFKDEMGVEVKYETEVKTLPDNPDGNGKLYPEEILKKYPKTW